MGGSFGESLQTEQCTPRSEMHLPTLAGTVRAGNFPPPFVTNWSTAPSNQRPWQIAAILFVLYRMLNRPRLLLDRPPCLLSRVLCSPVLPASLCWCTFPEIGAWLPKIHPQFCNDRVVSTMTPSTNLLSKSNNTASAHLPTFFKPFLQVQWQTRSVVARHSSLHAERGPV